MSAHAFHPMCGCDACGRVEDADEARDEAIDALVSNPTWRARNTPIADEWRDGMHDGSWYSAAERLLADLHDKHPDDLLGSGLLASLYELARTAAALRAEKMREIAETEVDGRRAAA